MELGVFVGFDTNVEEKIKSVRDMGFSSCQLSAWNHDLFTERNGREDT